MFLRNFAHIPQLYDVGSSKRIKTGEREERREERKEERREEGRGERNRENGQKPHFDPFRLQGAIFWLDIMLIHHNMRN